MNDVKVDWDAYARMRRSSETMNLIPIERRDGTVEFYEDGKCVASLVPASAYLDEVMKEFHPDYVPPAPQEAQEKQSPIDDEGKDYPF